MPTDIELEPVTGKALQEFSPVYQSVVYNLPEVVSLWPASRGTPWTAMASHDLGLIGAIICQLACGMGPTTFR